MAKTNKKKGVAFWVIGGLLVVGAVLLFKPKKKGVPKKVTSIPVEEETTTGGGGGGFYGGGISSTDPRAIQDGDVIDAEGNKIPDAVEQEAIDTGTTTDQILPQITDPVASKPSGGLTSLADIDPVTSPPPSLVGTKPSSEPTSVSSPTSISSGVTELEQETGTPTPVASKPTTQLTTVTSTTTVKK